MTAEDAQAAPLVLVAVVAVTALALVMVQGGRMGLLDATADTAADAAALAGADAVVEELLGPPGLTWLLTGELPPSSRDRVVAAAQSLAAANDAELTDLSIATDGRSAVTVTVGTRSLDELGEPALDDTQRDFRGTSVAAARTSVSFTGPGDRGCMSQPEVDEVADRLGLESLRHDPSGLSACRGADVRNLAPVTHEAVLLLEQAAPEPVLFTSGFRTYEDQARLFEDPTNPYPVAEPGTSWHHTGLAFDASNHGVLAEALETMDDPPLCQPYPVTDPVHFSHADYAECGGALPRPSGPAGMRIEGGQPALVAAP